MFKRINSFMPLIVIVVLVFALILAGSFTLRELTAESKRLSGKLELLEKDIGNQNWKEAQEKLESFRSEWDSTSSVWSMLIDHYEIDNIELVLSQLASYVKTQDKNEALSELSSLKAFIKHIPDKESFSLKNIL